MSWSVPTEYIPTVYNSFKEKEVIVSKLVAAFVSVCRVGENARSWWLVVGRWVVG